MVASLINNAIQVYFDSVFSMADEGMVQMFKALESSGLRGFLGCSSTIYEAALVDFYHNASVRDNKVISSIQGKSVEISEEQFAGIFELPTNGLTDMNEVPKDLVFDAISAFSTDGEQLKTFCKKREMKFEFRLLNDILGNTSTVKAGSFDVFTHERFMMMAAIHGGVKINWGRLLFNLLKDMAFPRLKILTAKTAGTYIAKNKSINAEEVLEVPVEKVVKKAAAKRRPALAVVEPAAKKKRTTVGRAAPTKKDLAMVPVVQNPEPISVVPVVTPRAQRRRAPKRKLVLRGDSNDETVENIIKQVLTETTEVEDVQIDLEEQVVMKTAGTDLVETESRVDVSAITNYDEEEPMVETEKETKKEKEKEKEKIIDL
ncbi:hypothetical protein F511_16042 [Dorcoceras hygrometricum]|uniref:Splicing factor 3B subunit 1-like n=1 Tax=Dorcoceras hygrometricum TaxID=472368 RepID=A0A2Z7B6N5_9LAMI|nr:hypothetical protein F511_16042 [Dorcoceras hygrometricum]